MRRVGFFRTISHKLFWKGMIVVKLIHNKPNCSWYLWKQFKLAYLSLLHLPEVNELMRISDELLLLLQWFPEIYDNAWFFADRKHTSLSLSLSLFLSLALSLSLSLSLCLSLSLSLYIYNVHYGALKKPICALSRRLYHIRDKIFRLLSEFCSLKYQHEYLWITHISLI